MTGLWAMECGCEYGSGHSCRPPWLTAEEWSPKMPACDDIAPDNLVGSRGKERGAGTGNTGAPDPQCIIALRDQDST